MSFSWYIPLLKIVAKGAGAQYSKHRDEHPLIMSFASEMFNLKVNHMPERTDECAPTGPLGKPALHDSLMQIMPRPLVDGEQLQT